VNVFILLLRGVNVSGANIVKMAEFRTFLTGQGFGDVQTYIQSGNALFSSAKSADAARLLLSEAFAPRFGFTPKMMLVMAADLAAAISGNPFTDPGVDPARLHAGFMAQEPGGEAVSALAGRARGDEEYQISGRVFYLFTPEGLGNSKFAASIEKTLKVPVTFRNWRTVMALEEMAGALNSGAPT
jgi:uncharacterized protein (DUF1697 family)